MCTAATYQTKDFYMGRTLDYEFSYGEQIAIIPRNYPIKFHYAGTMEHHYAMHWHGTCSKWISIVL